MLQSKMPEPKTCTIAVYHTFVNYYKKGYHKFSCKCIVWIQISYTFPTKVATGNSKL